MDLGQILLHFLELHRVVDDVRVVLAIDHALLQTGEDFRPRHADRAGALGLIGGEHDLVLRHTDLHAFKVFQRRHRTLGVGQITEVGIQPADDVDAGLFLGDLVPFIRQRAGGGLDGIRMATQCIGHGERGA